MTDPRPLTPLLAPRSVAICGASTGPGGSAAGRCAVSSKLVIPAPNASSGRGTVQGVPAYPDLASVPGSVEFALIAVPAAFAAAVFEASIEGVRAVSMFAAGYAESGEGRITEGVYLPIPKA